jgi:hypothetical protein
MNEFKYRVARQTILETLSRRRKWGGSHTHYKYAFARIPREEWGSKEVKQAFSDLVKEEKILLKKTVEEAHVSLNTKLSEEIKAEINASINIY